MPIDQISTPRELVCALMRWVRAGGKDREWLPLYQWLAAHPACNDVTDIARFRSWKSLLYHNTPEIRPAQAAALFAVPRASPSGNWKPTANVPISISARYGLALHDARARR